MLKKIYIFILVLTLGATPIFATDTETGSALENYLKSIDERVGNTLESMNKFQQESTDRFNSMLDTVGGWFGFGGEPDAEPEPDTGPINPFPNISGCWIKVVWGDGTSRLLTLENGHTIAFDTSSSSLSYSTIISSSTDYRADGTSYPTNFYPTGSTYRSGVSSIGATNCYHFMRDLNSYPDGNTFITNIDYVGYGDYVNNVLPDDDPRNPNNPNYVKPQLPLPKPDMKVRFNVYWWDFPALVQLDDGTYAIRTVGTNTTTPLEPDLPDIPEDGEDKEGLPEWDEEKQDFDDGDDGFWSKIFKFIWDTIKKIFIPENDANGDNFITIEFNKMNTQLTNKLPVVNQFNVMFDTVFNEFKNNPKYNSKVAPTFKITAFGSTYDIIDFSFMNDYIELIHGIIQFCAYFLFGRKVLKRLPSIIRGI